VKFVSESAAGQAFRLLHGWMYDGRNSVLIVYSQFPLNQPFFLYLLLMIRTPYSGMACHVICAQQTYYHNHKMNL